MLDFNHITFSNQTEPELATLLPDKPEDLFNRIVYVFAFIFIPVHRPTHPTCPFFTIPTLAWASGRILQPKGCLWGGPKSKSDPDGKHISTVPPPSPTHLVALFVKLLCSDAAYVGRYVMCPRPFYGESQLPIPHFGVDPPPDLNSTAASSRWRVASSNEDGSSSSDVSFVSFQKWNHPIIVVVVVRRRFISCLRLLHAWFHCLQKAVTPLPDPRPRSSFLTLEE